MLNIDMEKLKIASFHENSVKRSSSSWLGHKPSKLAIPGSNPGDRTFCITLKEFAPKQLNLEFERLCVRV